MPKKSNPAPNAWESKTIKEAVIASKVWRSQKLKAPDGTVMYGLRAFAKKANGDLVQTSQGFTVKAEECTGELIQVLTDLLRTLSPTKTNQSSSTVGMKQYFLFNKKTGKYAKSVEVETCKFVVTSNQDQAQLFRLARAKKILERKASPDWTTKVLADNF